MKGICFIPPLYDATIKEIKDQTRRIIPEQFKWSDFRFLSVSSGEITAICPYEDGITYENERKHSRYKVDDILYLKEPYHILNDGSIAYKFTLPGIDIQALELTWKNKLFMPASAARHFIKITGVRAERLQDITEDDCRREGILDVEFYPDEGFPLSIGHTHYDDGKSVLYTTRNEAYAALIDKINGKGTWDSNPFVWVYDYKLIEKEG